MGMSNYAEYGFGLVLSDKNNEINNFIEKVFPNVKNEIGNEITVYDLTESPEFDGFARFYDSDMEGKYFQSVTFDYSENEDMLVFWAKRQPDAFNAVYTEESIVEEFKNRIGKYLPDDFDYLNHIGYFSCCIYC